MVSSENSRVFMWKAFGEWKSSLKDMFGDILTPELEAKVKHNRAIVEYCDDPEAFEKLAGHSIDLMVTTEKINEFRQRYSHIRVYHGCRPIDVQSYYEKGLLLCDMNALVDRFREIFLSGDYPELTEEILQKSIKEAAPYSVGRDGESCLHIDDRFLVEYCGHYLIYGSEYLSGLINHLPIENAKKDQYLFALREIGKPTFLEINLPNTTEYIEDGIIYQIIQEMLTGWTFCLAHSRTESCLFDCTFTLNKPLLPKHICSHYHPRKITDTGYKIYDAETGEYEDVA